MLELPAKTARHPRKIPSLERLRWAASTREAELAISEAERGDCRRLIASIGGVQTATEREPTTGGRLIQLRESRQLATARRIRRQQRGPKRIVPESSQRVAGSVRRRVF